MLSDKAQKNKKNNPYTSRRHPGDGWFAFALVGIAAFLLLSIPWQTKWINGMSFFAQPRFWPGLAIVGMGIFSVLYLYTSLRARDETGQLPAQLEECREWLKPLEYIGYFLLYVFLVPRLGYLFSTLLFCLLLTRRAGYRNRKLYIAAFGVGLSVVLVFKFFLQVKIPGGEVYQFLPDSLRNFMIINF